MGKRFGFARFQDVKEPRMFAVRLDNIFIGSTKIYVNIPRHQRTQTIEGPRSYGWRNIKEGKEVVAHKREARDTKEGRSENHVAGKNRITRRWCAPVRHGKPTQNVFSKKRNEAELCFVVSEEEMDKFNKMYVGMVKNPGSTHMVQEWMNMQGFFSVKVMPMGANKVLMEEMEEGIIPALLADACDWVYEIFDVVLGWSMQEVDNERVVWVRCHGFPAHVWNTDFFSSLARKFQHWVRNSLVTTRMGEL